MRRFQVWHYLIPVFTAFWILFAIIIITSGFPFLVVSLALPILALLSLLVIALAWAFQNNI